MSSTSSKKTMSREKHTHPVEKKYVKSKKANEQQTTPSLRGPRDWRHFVLGSKRPSERGARRCGHMSLITSGVDGRRFQGCLLQGSQRVLFGGRQVP